MPIDFPSNPSSGQTYSYAGQQWEYNGVAWDKIITADIANDSNALYGISGSIYASNLATGLLYGGILSINAGNSAQFDITAGKGQIHAAGSTYTADPQPTLNYVTWPAQSGITLTYLATNDTTWIYIDPAGNVQQRTEYYTDDQLEENIIIGQLVHPSRTFINLARTNPNVAYATDRQYEQFIRSFGPIKVSGHTISPNGSNLKLNRTSGTAFSLGRNWINDTDNPSVVSDPAQTDCIFYRYYRGATAGTFITVPNQTAIDPTKYDNGTGTLATVPGGKYTIQRIFYYPNTPTLLGVYYGRAEYTSLADAAANINFENFTEIENTKTNAIFAAYLLVKSGATDLTNTSDALILQAGNFRSTTSGGGSVSLMLDDLTDVIISSPQNYQVLTYVDGVTGWENLSVTSLPLVSSLRGLTGAVGITNNAGIGLSVSGNTLTVSNTGVVSVNGATQNIILNAGQGITSSISGSTYSFTLNYIQGASAITGLKNPDLADKIVVQRPSTNVMYLTDIEGVGYATSGVVSKLNTISSEFIKVFTDDGASSTTSKAISGTSFINQIRLGTVTSVNGLTGDIGITNGSGIGLSVSGNTLSVSNTGVLSVNGATGAITNVAKTNAANTFNQTQYVEGSGALGSSYLAEYGGSGVTFNFDTGIDTGSQRWAAGLAGGSNTTITFPNDTGTVALTKNVVSSFNGLTGAVTGVTTGTTNTFGPLQSFTNGISSAGGTFSALTRFTAGISASGGMTLSGSLQGSTATFSGWVNINKSSVYGVTAESRFVVTYTASNLTAINKLYSYYTSTSSLSGVTICKILNETVFDNTSGSYKISIANIEIVGANQPYSNLSTFMVTLSNSSTLNWSEISSFNGTSIPVYDLSYDGDYISISATQTAGKIGALYYIIEIEQIG